MLGESRLFCWKDKIADQTIGAAPNKTMMAAPGVTNAQPLNCSESSTRRTADTVSSLPRAPR